MAARKSTRPKAIRVGRLVGVSVVRGPHPDDDACWYWRARQKGSPTPIWTGWGTAAEVEAEVIALLAGGLPAESDEPGAPIETVKQLLEYWLGESQLPRSDIGENRRRGLKSAGRIVSRIIGHVVLERVDQGTVEKLRNGMAAEGYAPGTQKVVVDDFLAAWRWGQELGYCDPRRLSTPRIERRPLPRAQPTWEDFWWAVEATRHPIPPRKKPGETPGEPRLLPAWVRLMLQIIGLTGARIGEVAALERADLRLAGPDPAIFFGRHPGARKTGERCTLIPGELVAILEAWLESGGGALPRRRGSTATASRLLPVSFSAARAGCQKALLELPWKAGQRFTARDVRNLVVDTYYNEQRDPSVEARQLGHSPQMALETYRRVRDQHVRAQIATIRSWLPPGSGGPTVTDIEEARRRRDA